MLVKWRRGHITLVSRHPVLHGVYSWICCCQMLWQKQATRYMKTSSRVLKESKVAYDKQASVETKACSLKKQLRWGGVLRKWCIHNASKSSILQVVIIKRKLKWYTSYVSLLSHIAGVETCARIRNMITSDVVSIIGVMLGAVRRHHHCLSLVVWAGHQLYFLLVITTFYSTHLCVMSVHSQLVSWKFESFWLSNE